MGKRDGPKTHRITGVPGTRAARGPLHPSCRGVAVTKVFRDVDGSMHVCRGEARGRGHLRCPLTATPRSQLPVGLSLKQRTVIPSSITSLRCITVYLRPFKSWLSIHLKPSVSWKTMRFTPKTPPAHAVGHLHVSRSSHLAGDPVAPAHPSPRPSLAGLLRHGVRRGRVDPHPTTRGRQRGLPEDVERVQSGMNSH